MIPQLILLIPLALAVSLVLVRAGRKGPGPFAGLLSFFLLFVLFGWAANLWLVPTGPETYGVYWAGPLVATLVLAFILLAVIPASAPSARREERVRQDRESPSETEVRHAVELGFTVFFWIAVLGLAFVIAANYFFS